MRWRHILLGLAAGWFGWSSPARAILVIEKAPGAAPVGGYLVGEAVGFFAQNQGVAPEWRLFAITGFLGGLTTFSTFSAEVVTLLSRGQPQWAVATAAAHLAGSLALTALGMATVRAIA